MLVKGTAIQQAHGKIRRFNAQTFISIDDVDLVVRIFFVKKKLGLEFITKCQYGTPQCS